jgi:uncharacterized protein YtpQ (UPF0354 family)
MADVVLRNESNFEFKDISSEKYRTYVWDNETKITIDEPQWIAVSESGGHRIVDKEEKSHYIPAGWIQLYWEVKSSHYPHFVF